MKRSRITAIAWIAAVGALALAGCAGGGSSDSGASKSLTVWVMGDSAKNFDQLVAPFQKRTGITVTTVAVPWDSIDQKFTTAVASGNGPDVLQIGLSKLRTYADTGALLQLDASTTSGEKHLASSNFFDGVAGKATAVNGRIVSIPWISDTRVLFYRSDILAQAGIDQPPATWDELRADAKTLAARGAGKYGYYIPQWDSALPVEMTWGQGGDIVNKDGAIDFDTAAFHKAVDLYTGFYADKSVPTNSDFDQVQGFTSGIAPMVVSGPYLAAAIKQAAPDLDGKWSAVPLPSATTNTSLLGGSNLGVWKKTKNRQGALDLLDFLSEPSTQADWYGIDGDLPTVKAAFGDSKLSSDPLVKVYAKQLDNAKILPLVPNWDGQTGKALLDALNSIVLTGAAKDAALATLYSATSGQSIK